jgi:large subunit ribosomal protein L44
MRTLINRKHVMMWYRSREWEAMQQKEPTPRQKLTEWNHRSEMWAFVKRLGEDMSEDRLKTVFTDQSYISMERKKRDEMGIQGLDLSITDNQDYALQGQSVMSPFIKKYLRYFLPHLPEEGIAALHDFLMDRDSLADMGTWLGVPEIIFCDNYYPDEEMIATTLKAFIGALSEEKGNKHAEKFIIDFIMTYMNDKHIFEIWDLTDVRSVLRQVLQNQGMGDFESRLARQTGQHTVEATFQVALFVDKKMIGTAAAGSLADAEEMAAFDALKRMFKIRPGEYIFRFGTEAYDLDYDSCKQGNSSLSTWGLVAGKKVNPQELHG